MSVTWERSTRGQRCAYVREKAAKPAATAACTPDPAQVYPGRPAHTLPAVFVPTPHTTE